MQTMPGRLSLPVQKPAMVGRITLKHVEHTVLGAQRQTSRRIGPFMTNAADNRSSNWLLGSDEPIYGIDKQDAAKELSRVNERTISTFTFERWADHRSTKRYTRHVMSLFQSSIIRGLARPLLSVAGVSTLVCMYEDLLADGTLPTYFPSFYLPTAPFDLTSFALALLLVFRTNTSYDRWLEVSTVWGNIANRGRDTMRQVISHLSEEDSVSPLAAAMCRWVIAYARSLKSELVPDCDLDSELKDVLTTVERDQLMVARHRPSFALSVLTELAGAANLRESHRIRLDENLTFFEDAVGACERILRTPIPLAYTRHTSRFMVIWLTALPLGLYESCSWGTIPLSVVIAFLLLGIDEIGVQIEEPFGLLPLEDLCLEIEGDMFAMLQESAETKRTATAAAAAAMGIMSSETDVAPFTPLPSAINNSTARKVAQPHIEWGEMYRSVDEEDVAEMTGAFVDASEATSANR